MSRGGILDPLAGSMRVLKTRIQIGRGETQKHISPMLIKPLPNPFIAGLKSSAYNNSHSLSPDLCGSGISMWLNGFQLLPPQAAVAALARACLEQGVLHSL